MVLSSHRFCSGLLLLFERLKFSRVDDPLVLP